MTIRDFVDPQERDAIKDFVREAKNAHGIKQAVHLMFADKDGGDPLMLVVE
jgi:hypothetical protein